MKNQWRAMQYITLLYTVVLFGLSFRTSGNSCYFVVTSKQMDECVFCIIL